MNRPIQPAQHLQSQVPVELQAPDIRPYRRVSAAAGTPAIDYLVRLESGKPGPHVLIQALTHGNELCGAIALDFLLQEDVRPLQGVLSLVFANVEAYHRWDPENPHGNRFCDEDYNRLWGDDVLKGPRDSIELRRARELVNYIDSADYLLDLHSMSAPCEALMVCGVREHGGIKAVAMTQGIGLPRWLMMDTGHPAGLRMIERGRFGDPRAKAVAALLEAGQHWERKSEAVARDASLRFLAYTGLIDRDWALSRCSLAPEQQRVIQVTEAVIAKTKSFQWLADYQGLEVIEHAGTAIAQDGDACLRTPYDDCVLVMPTRARFTVGNTMLRFGRIES
ncbi:MAG: succinylglutamate desuccinylase [Betaproteobacteria bacterium]|nr:succinylglutamate desuccinylase [Betaproteobacteria bacterium]